MPDFSKPYNPQETEQKIYELWLQSGFFTPENLPPFAKTSGDKPVERTEPFTVMMPPPNVTGALHMGHALMLTLEDIMIRYKRMRGFKTLWLPGTDHAAIATQAKVEKDIYKKEGKSRSDLGREEFLRRVEQFAQESHNTIISQIRVMGASCDWTREAYTLDEQRSRAVRTVFKNMYEDGLIYRGHRIVNWDTKGQTTISDDEIVYEERSTKLYTFKYSKDFPIPIATTRPETKVGDTGVAVHPDDERYKQFIGKEYDLTFCGILLHIKIVADSAVDPEFGTGAVGITPAHSHIDWEIGQRHKLEVKQVIDEHARMMVDNKSLKDKKTAEARTAIVEWLQQEKLLLKDPEDIKQNIATAERTGSVIEPLPKLQWFVGVNKEFEQNGSKTTLKEIMRNAVQSGQIKMIPERFEKIYFHWIENLRDWCISRQLWYGHRIPVWYHEPRCIPKQEYKTDMSQCKDIIVNDTEPKCEYCNARYIQDPDTLDTWFSSGLWTFSTLGWPDKTEDIKMYHPTDVLETGYEIIFFWVARMILMTGYSVGAIPFRTAYFHGTVRDAQGRKMSKSLGNGIDPIDIAKKFGTDAGRMALIIGNTPGTDLALSEDKIRGYKNFANKIWNAARFVIENTQDFDISTIPTITEKDRQTLSYLKEIVQDVTQDMENFKFYLAAEKLYHYFWHTFADIVIEEAKPRIKNGAVEEKTSAQYMLREVLSTCLKLLHPFIPFITEAVWEKILQKDKTLLMIEKWPYENYSN